ncbi:hypothetical protein ACFQZZ_33195 [Nocardia sp. GCM10030253]|uniref:hypothetical protein n=1 Tax=Nocardia sp. GCM10030253 TaxID=3273404 RepID=UPI00363C7A0A
MTTVSVHRLNESDPAVLYTHYEGEYEPQGCHVELNTESGELRADWDGILGNGMPESVYHSRTLRWGIPALTAEAANALLAELVPLAQTVLDGWTVEWNGSNNVGYATTEQADTAIELIAMRCGRREDGTDWWPMEDRVVASPAADWFAESPDVDAELGITATTTDSELEHITEQVRAEAATASEYGYQILLDTPAYLTERRDRLRSDS